MKIKPMLSYFLFLVIISFGIIGCSRDSSVKQSGTDAKKEDVTDETPGHEPSPDNEKVEEPIEENPIRVKERNDELFPNAKYTSDTIQIKEEVPVTMQKTDDMLQGILESGQYTFTEPYLVLNPYGSSPLTALVLFQTEEECKVRVTVKGDEEATDVSGVLDATRLHRVPIIGLYPDRENTVVLELLNENEEVTESKEIKIQTEPLPEFMSNMVSVKQKGEDTAYPLTIISGMGAKYPFAYDRNGAVRWYVTNKTDNYGIFPLSNFRFILQHKTEQVPTEEKPHTTTMYEMDYLGRIHQSIHVKNGYHHEVIEKVPGGNLLLLSSSIDGHVEDVVEEIDRETGHVVKSLDMREVFDSLKYVDRIDWAHLNTVSYKEEDDTVLLSPRNLHSGVRVNWSTNELKWILCNPQFWEGTAFRDKVLTPVGDIVWFFQPHSIYEIPHDLDGNPDTVHVMVYDNHWDKTRKVDFFDGREESYVSIFTIDEKKMTVTQDRVYPSYLSKITSNCAFHNETKRVFSFGGFLQSKVEGNGGVVYEYDYETGKVKNQYLIKTSYYRGYQMVVDYNVCAAPMNIGDNYIKGELVEPIEKKGLKVPKQVFGGRDVDFVLKGSRLHMKANDHAVTCVEFIGSGRSYQRDYSSAKEGEEKYLIRKYDHVIPLDQLESDTYGIVINYKGTRYDTGHRIMVGQ